MSDSIKDRFLKEHELSLEDLDKVSGGDPEFVEFAGYSFPCPNCKHCVNAIREGDYVSDLCCAECGWFYYGILTKEEAEVEMV